MPQPRRKWRLPLGVVFTGIVGATLATLISLAPQLTMQFSRRHVAGDMQQEFQKHGLNYAVATAGAEDTTLRIKAPTMTKPFAEFLVQDPAKAQQLGQMGFTAVVFANDQGGSWTYDINQRQFR